MPLLPDGGHAVRHIGGGVAGLEKAIRGRVVNGSRVDAVMGLHLSWLPTHTDGAFQQVAASLLL